MKIWRGTTATGIPELSAFLPWDEKRTADLVNAFCIKLSASIESYVTDGFSGYWDVKFKGKIVLFHYHDMAGFAVFPWSKDDAHLLDEIELFLNEYDLPPHEKD